MPRVVTSVSGFVASDVKPRVRVSRFIRTPGADTMCVHANRFMMPQGAAPSREHARSRLGVACLQHTHDALQDRRHAAAVATRLRASSSASLSSNPATWIGERNNFPGSWLAKRAALRAL